MNKQAKQDFYDGKLFDAYHYMGAHKTKAGFQFTTYAPNAKKIALVGDFNNWKEQWMVNDNNFLPLMSHLPNAEIYTNTGFIQVKLNV